MRVLIACEFSGIVRDAFLKLGFDAVSCDLLDTEQPGPHIKGDVRDILGDGWDLMIAHPPCTYLASSGARWWSGKKTEQKEAISFFMELVDAPINKIAVENPVGLMSTVYRKPDQYIQPYMFGHGETKKTCLWLKNLRHLLPSNPVDGRVDRVHRLPPGPDRWKERSRTYQGVANAMAVQWGFNFYYV